ncbi:hypothetical protein [Actibacterium sp. MT2.3-13A]|uniref:hypothetical protein n=1 Tax=Actibacterium sp. MT2.3-13A TaxID=2828332 RepID=UPI001BA4E1B7|nr:hypothetical protein [Actibacterium sp. MT2.3-13A]
MAQIPTIKVVNEKARGGFMIINESDFDPDVHEPFEAAEPVTREGVAKMKKSDVIELLKAHGVEDTDGNLPDLRERLIGVMFVDL